MLKTRLLSALALLPLPILALYFGSPWFELFAALLLATMGWEWEKMVLGRFTVCGMAAAVVGVCGVYMLDLLPEAALVLPAVATVVLYVVVKKQDVAHPVLYALGVPYTAYPMMAIAYLSGEGGFPLTIWLFALVWAMDTGAYVFGKTIGGPKLCPKVSPKKTWAGLIGGMATAALWGYACAWYLQADDTLKIVVLTAVLAAVSQGGDLLESAVKRYLGVKDSSDLIPGHGGVFDRLDALLAVAPVVALLVFFYGYRY